MTSVPASPAPENRLRVLVITIASQAMLYAPACNLVAKRRIGSLDGSHKTSESGHSVRKTTEYNRLTVLIINVASQATLYAQDINLIAKCRIESIA